VSAWKGRPTPKPRGESASPAGHGAVIPRPAAASTLQTDHTAAEDVDIDLVVVDARLEDRIIRTAAILEHRLLEVEIGAAVIFAAFVVDFSPHLRGV
jgi:hypothetical protein